MEMAIKNWIEKSILLFEFLFMMFILAICFIAHMIHGFVFQLFVIHMD